jgi:hypothetical protein
MRVRELGDVLGQNSPTVGGLADVGASASPVAGPKQQRAALQDPAAIELTRAARPFASRRSVERAPTKPRCPPHVLRARLATSDLHQGSAQVALSLEGGAAPTSSNKPMLQASDDPRDRAANNDWLSGLYHTSRIYEDREWDRTAGARIRESMERERLRYHQYEPPPTGFMPDASFGGFAQTQAPWAQAYPYPLGSPFGALGIPMAMARPVAYRSPPVITVDPNVVKYLRRKEAKLYTLAVQQVANATQHFHHARTAVEQLQFASNVWAAQTVRTIGFSFFVGMLGAAYFGGYLENATRYYAHEAQQWLSVLEVFTPAVQRYVAKAAKRSRESKES